MVFPIIPQSGKQFSNFTIGQHIFNIFFSKHLSQWIYLSARTKREFSFKIESYVEMSKVSNSLLIGTIHSKDS